MNKLIRICAGFMLMFVYLNAFPQISYREEFNGPFASWANVKKRFGAAGDGIKDDTRAIQTAIDSLSVFLGQEFNTKTPTRYIVIYLPAGTYNISKTLRINGKIGFSIIGEDPLKTVIRWQGADGDTMLLANGSSYYKISRITWNPGSAKNIEAIGIHWLDRNGVRFAATSIELSDMIFKKGLAYGVFGGTYGHDGVGANDAEVLIRRCKFYNSTAAAICIKGFNALDYWIWDCEFNDCKRGIECHHGNYHVYNSQFYRSSDADMYNRDGYYTSVRGSYSKNSGMFSFDEGGSCNAFKRIFQGNIVEGYYAIPIQYHSQGRMTLMDNYFFKKGSKANKAVDYNSWCPANYQVLSLGNYFEDSEPMIVGRSEFPKRIFSIADRNAVKQKIKISSPAVPALPPFLPFVKRKIFEVAVGANAKQIQSVINEAAKLNGQRPVVHVPPGTYYLNQSLVIPAGSDMQLIGDGILFGTVFKKEPQSGNPYCIIVKGPSYVSFQHFEVSVAGRENGILFEGIDQEKSEVHIDQIYTTQAQTTLFTDRLNYIYIEKNNAFYSAGNIAIGGELVKNGKGSAVIFCFGGQGAKTTLQNNAVMVAKDCWWEGPGKREVLPLDLKGEGRYTLDGAMIAPAEQDSTATIRINDFKGAVTLSNLYLYGGADINNGANNLKVLLWNINFLRKQNPMNFIKSGFKPSLAMLGITSECSKTAASSCKDETIISHNDQQKNITDINAFLDVMTRDMRNAKPRPFRELSSKASNVYIYRVSVSGGNVGLTFRP